MDLSELSKINGVTIIDCTNVSLLGMEKFTFIEEDHIPGIYVVGGSYPIVLFNGRFVYSSNSEKVMEMDDLVLRKDSVLDNVGKVVISKKVYRRHGKKLYTDKCVYPKLFLGYIVDHISDMIKGTRNNSDLFDRYLPMLSKVTHASTLKNTLSRDLDSDIGSFLDDNMSIELDSIHDETIENRNIVYTVELKGYYIYVYKKLDIRLCDWLSVKNNEEEIRKLSE